MLRVVGVPKEKNVIDFFTATAQNRARRLRMPTPIIIFGDEIRSVTRGSPVIIQMPYIFTTTVAYRSMVEEFFNHRYKTQPPMAGWNGAFFVDMIDLVKDRNLLPIEVMFALQTWFPLLKVNRAILSPEDIYKRRLQFTQFLTQQTTAVTIL